MTARAVTPLYVDAATVYAEGVLAGLRTAANIVAGKDDGYSSNLALARTVVDRLPAGEDREALIALLDLLKVSAPPLRMQAQIREWRAHVYHNQWLAERGVPADMPRMPDRAQVLARIHAFLATFPDYADAD